MIETISTSAVMPTGQLPYFDLKIGESADHPVKATFLGENTFYSEPRQPWMVTEQLLVRVPEGVSICVELARNTPPGLAAFSASLDGYYVNYP